MRIRNPKNADLICERLAEGFTLRQIGKLLNCDGSAIRHWVLDDDEFAQRYARAMELRCERMAEEIQEISDEGSNDWMVREGQTVADHEHIQRSKLRVDARKWLLSKMMPKKYGERVSAELTGRDGKDLIPEAADPGKLAAALHAVLKDKPKD